MIWVPHARTNGAWIGMIVLTEIETLSSTNAKKEAKSYRVLLEPLLSLFARSRSLISILPTREELTWDCMLSC